MNTILEWIPSPAMVRPSVIARADVRTREVVFSVYPASNRTTAALITAAILVTDNLDFNDTTGWDNGVAGCQRHRRCARCSERHAQQEKSDSDQVPPSAMGFDLSL